MAYSRTIAIKLDTKGLSLLRAAVDPRAEKVLDVAARAIEKGWKDEIVAKNVIDTGNYLDSIHVEGTHPPLQRTVADGVEYGVFLEFGAQGRPARPCATPAVEMERPRLEKAWKELFAK